MRARAGIDRVLDQFLHGRGRTLDHLARRDAVDQDGIEAADGHGAFRVGDEAQLSWLRMIRIAGGCSLRGMRGFAAIR